MANEHAKNAKRRTNNSALTMSDDALMDVVNGTVTLSTPTVVPPSKKNGKKRLNGPVPAIPFDPTLVKEEPMGSEVAQAAETSNTRPQRDKSARGTSRKSNGRVSAIPFDPTLVKDEALGSEVAQAAETINTRPQRDKSARGTSRKLNARVLAYNAGLVKNESDSDDSSMAVPPPRKKRAASRAAPSKGRNVHSQADSAPGTSSQMNGHSLVTPKQETIYHHGRSMAAIMGPGGVKGRPLQTLKRDQLEKASRVIYPFPCHLPYASDPPKRVASRAERVLDLVLDGDVSDEESDPNKIYVINGIIYADDHSVLVDWKGFKYSTWEPNWRVPKGVARTDYTRRLKTLEPVLDFIWKNETPMSFRTNYPNFAIHQTMDYFEYDRRPSIVYLTGLRNWERQVNDFLNEQYGRSKSSEQLITFEDCTSFEKSSIPVFEYLIDSQLSASVQELEKDLKSSKKKGCKCVTGCASFKGCCSHKSETGDSYVAKNVLGSNENRTNSGDVDYGFDSSSKLCVDVFECGDGCGCARGKGNCIQRAVQTGSLVKLIVFRHNQKGWTLHTGQDLVKGSFVVAYVGEMITLTEAGNRNDSMYHFEFPVKLNSGRTRKFVIDSKKKGNVSRHIAHSCSPNLFSRVIHFDIQNRPKLHIGFYAGKDIAAGVELTYDYFPQATSPQEFHDMTQKAKFTCRCSSDSCREKLYQETKKSISKRNKKE